MHQVNGRLRGRPHLRWLDCIKRDSNEAEAKDKNWWTVVQDRKVCRKYVAILTPESVAHEEEIERVYVKIADFQPHPIRHVDEAAVFVYISVLGNEMIYTRVVSQLARSIRNLTSLLNIMGSARLHYYMRPTFRPLSKYNGLTHLTQIATVLR